MTLTALIAGALLVACGGGSEQGEVEAALRRAVQAYNDADIEAYLALHTDHAIETEYGLQRDLAAESIAEFIGQPPIEVRRLSNVNVAGDRATVDFERTQGRVLVFERVALMKSGGDWKLDGFQDLPLEIPATATRVGIQMIEFSFAVDSDAVRDGNIALTVANAGQQDHEAVVARIADEATLAELVSAIAASPDGETPAGVEEVVSFGAYEPGESANVVFAEPLEPGRYAVFCFFPDVNDPEHTPHALKGMFAEFAVPG